MAKNYEDYNPRIEYTNEQEVAAEPAAAPQEPAGKRSRGKTGKPVQAKPKASTARKAKKQQPQAGFADRIKNWAQSLNVRLLVGIFLGFFGVYLSISFVSYLTSCIDDMSIVESAPLGYATGVSNYGGEGGARLADLLINRSFGLGSIVIIIWIFAMSLKLLIGRPKFKSVDFTIKCLVALLIVSMVVGLVTIASGSVVNWGGFDGRYVNQLIINFVGWSGAVIVALFLIAVFIVICLRDIVKWILKIKRRRDAHREKLRLAREEERRRMEMFEQMEMEERMGSAKSGEDIIPGAGEEETPQDSHVSFQAGDEHSENGDIEEEGFKEYRSDLDDNTLYGEGGGEYVIEDEAPLPTGNNGAQNASGAEATLNEASPAPSAASDRKDEAAESAEAAGEPMVVNVNQIAEAKEMPLKSQGGGINYKFPPTALLKEGVTRISVDSREQEENQQRIRKTLLDFGIPIVKIEATVGPTVTLYEIVPDKGVKISRIRNLVDDIALSLAAIGVRIIAPIPGRGTVGIEVANKDPQIVSMRTVLQSRKFVETRYKLPIALGSTINNEVYIADLAKMPHLLVAGATGQGKSVGLNAIIASLLYRKRPDELKFVMIDPKMVEFSLYAKIEQFYLAKLPGSSEPIITDMSKAVETLNSLCVEMDNRYMLLKGNSRNVEEYNEKVKRGQLDLYQGHRYLPYIVVIVDEFSDLIMTAGKDVEIPIARLAQKARAVGIHVIIATQRPSTNVITGIIKANFPARIAFKVSSGVDSKTILDTTGAQQLIGRGDMLISSNSEMTRVQCAFIDTPEVENICAYIAQQPDPDGPYILPEPQISSAEEGSAHSSIGADERDSLFEEVARRVVQSGTASTSAVQRLYSIGYNRAGRIMDQLEAAGIVGPATGGKPRSVLVDPMSLEGILAAL